MKNLITILFLLTAKLSFASVDTLPTCIMPKMNMGSNQAITLPSTSTILAGSASGQNGHPTITNYQWYLDSGGSGNVVTPNQTTTQVTGLLTAGVYKFALKAIDSCGAWNTGYIYVTVNPAQASQLLVTAIATPNVLQGQTSTVLSLTANYPVSQWWSDSTGPNQATLSGQANSSCTASNLIPGTYYFTYSATTQATNPAQTVKGIVVVTVNSSYTLTLVPNPARTQVTASLTGLGTGAVKINLYNVIGSRILQQKAGTKTASTFSATFNMNYKSGTYPMTAILNGAIVATDKLIIQ